MTGSPERPMTTNFLPDFDPVVTHGTEATVQSLIRDKAVRATPEERIRQRVLHWLIHDKGWSQESLRLEPAGVERELLPGTVLPRRTAAGGLDGALRVSRPGWSPGRDVDNP